MLTVGGTHGEAQAHGSQPVGLSGDKKLATHANHTNISGLRNPSSFPYSHARPRSWPAKSV